MHSDGPAVAYPEFPRGSKPKLGPQLIIWSIFPENCTEIKKIGSGVGEARLQICPCRSATDCHRDINPF